MNDQPSPATERPRGRARPARRTTPPPPQASRPSAWRLLWLPPLVFAGVWTLLASSTFEESAPDPQAEVSFTLTTLLAPLVVDDGIALTTTTDLRVAGSYQADAGDPLTLQRDGLAVDTTSGFNLEVDAEDPDDTLTGNPAVDVTFPLRIDRDGEASQGQLAVDDGTTTLVTVRDGGGGVDVQTGTGPTRFFDWQDFRDAAADTDVAEDARIAAFAYAQLPRVLRLSGIAEELVNAIVENERMLEGMNLNQPLSLTCDRTGGERVLFWRTDAPGSGEGEIGAGDGFETRFDNCFDSRLQRYVDGTITLEDYDPEDGDGPRTLGGDFTFSALFVAEDEVDLTTVPSPTAPRLSGTLSLAYDERPLEDDEAAKSSP